MHNIGGGDKVAPDLKIKLSSPQPNGLTLQKTAKGQKESENHQISEWFGMEGA